MMGYMQPIPSLGIHKSLIKTTIYDYRALACDMLPIKGDGEGMCL